MGTHNNALRSTKILIFFAASRAQKCVHKLNASFHFSSESEIRTNKKLFFSLPWRNTRTNRVVFTRFGTVHWITRPLTPTAAFYIKNEFACLFSAHTSAIGKRNWQQKGTLRVNRQFMHLLPLSVIIFTIFFSLVFHEKLVLLWFSASTMLAGTPLFRLSSSLQTWFLLLLLYYHSLDKIRKKKKNSLRASKVKGGLLNKYHKLFEMLKTKEKQTWKCDDWITISHLTALCWRDDGAGKNMDEETSTWNISSSFQQRSILTHQLHHFPIITMCRT